MEETLKLHIKNAVMEGIDLSGEIRDEDISQLIDSCIAEAGSKDICKYEFNKDFHS